MPVLNLPEVAVIGRSNVGKSTLLNHLFKSKNLVKVSSNPGKTRALNYFIVDEATAFVDLPGYGFANVSFQEKKKWSELIESYLKRISQDFLKKAEESPLTENESSLLNQPTSLKKFGQVKPSVNLLLLLLDIRRIPSEDDMKMLEWVAFYKLPAIVILTKCDKLKNSEKQRQTREILIRIKGLPYVHYSAIKNEGRKELITMISRQLYL